MLRSQESPLISTTDYLFSIELLQSQASRISRCLARPGNQILWQTTFRYQNPFNQLIYSVPSIRQVPLFVAKLASLQKLHTVGYHDTSTREELLSQFYPTFATVNHVINVPPVKKIAGHQISLGNRARPTHIYPDIEIFGARFSIGRLAK